jgi:hypothetical protein
MVGVMYLTRLTASLETPSSVVVVAPTVTRLSKPSNLLISIANVLATKKQDISTGAAKLVVISCAYMRLSTRTISFKSHN